MSNKLFPVIVLWFILHSCNLQKSSAEIEQSISSENIIEVNKPNIYKTTPSFLYSSNNNQISQVVRTIFQDSKGYLWFGGEGGAFKLAGDSLIHVDSIRGESGQNVTIKDITEDKNGVVWLGHTDGLSSIDGEKVTNYYESDGLISNDIWCITTDRKGRVWIGTIEGICVFDGQAFKKFDLPEGKMDSTVGISSTQMVHNILEDSRGTLWFSSNAGLFSHANDSLINISEKAGFETNFINEVFNDKNDGLWVSTKNGLYSLINGKAENITLGKIETGKGIGSIAEDEEGNMWFVSNQHYLYTYDGNELIEFQQSENNKGPVVFQIYKDQSNRLWFVGFGGAYRLENGTFVNITRTGPW